ncbi:hypothetical protein ES708_09067 [subsurface metagenome]
MLMGRHFIDRRRTRIKIWAVSRGGEWFSTLASPLKERGTTGVRLINNLLLASSEGVIPLFEGCATI